ncbi:MAG: phytoene desaturase family protein [Anaerolineales bacterium]|nr:phytoene desaturase family protein [Anaerolineales bacterium]MCX7755474.1 phytoene desaturase family protein [Anaerolineales bacterium]MDW8278276.1 phytoene desaturase family protein [Anaerolineales bacterium]
MASKPTAIVIGAGIGGIATAARLAKNGYSVTVLEKNAQAGGRCNQIVREGHRFDIGPTLFLMPEVWEETFQALGERMSDHLDLRRIDPTYKVHFEDGLQLQLTSDIGKMQDQLEAVEKTAFTGFLSYIAEGARHYKISLEKFVGRNFYSLLEYFSLSNLPLIFQLKALDKHYRNTSRYFKDERLKAAFTFQNMYLGLSPYDAPATYSLLQYTELAEGVWYPMGGMYAAIQALTRIAEKLGVRFIYNAPVKTIQVQGSQVLFVETEDGARYAGDIFVGNADLPYIYDQLLPDRAEARKLDEKLYTCSTIMFYWGVDKQYPQIAHHNVFLAGDYKASFDRIFQDHTLPDAPSFYVHAPARTDPAAAPAGQDTLYVLVPVGHLDARTRQDWDAMVKRARETVFARLEKEMGINDLREHIKFEITYTPLTWQQQFNLQKGAAFGLSHNFWQVGYLRPHNRHAKYRNLYFAGASTHPGTGLPIVLLSARLTTERILKEKGTISVQKPSTVAAAATD